MTGSTERPSAATTVIVIPGMRTSMKLIAEPLMMRSRTFSPGVKWNDGLRSLGSPLTRSV